MITLCASCFASWLLYLYGYHRSGSDLSVLQEAARSKDLFVYVLTYFGASWTLLLPHKERFIALVSLVVLTALLISALRRRREVSDFEWILATECIMALFTSVLTAFGRLQFGVGQAFASRYQTPAMLYWGSLAALAMLWFHRQWPNGLGVPQALLLTLMLLSVLTFPRTLRSSIARADSLRAACQNVMGPHLDLYQAKKLYENPAVVIESRPLLIRIWRTGFHSGAWYGSRVPGLTSHLLSIQNRPCSPQ